MAFLLALTAGVAQEPPRREKCADALQSQRKRLQWLPTDLPATAEVTGCNAPGTNKKWETLHGDGERNWHVRNFLSRGQIWLDAENTAVSSRCSASYQT